MDWSYIAGFFDGEGNFHITSLPRGIYVICRIYGDSVEAFQEMINFMGFGKVYYRKKGLRVPELNIHKKEEVKKFLDNILPYLIVKRNHAKFILENYKFDNSNNLDFDKEGFYKFVRRKGVHNLRKNGN